MAFTLPRADVQKKRSDIRTEIIRKSIHMMIAFVPLLASINYMFTFILVASGVLIYTLAEYLRMEGVSVIAVSRLTAAAARTRDKDTFVMGPVTLGMGALLALLFYPLPVASLAIYALAFGDGLSSLIGKIYGSVTIPGTGGKTFEGSLTCFLTVLVIALRVSGGTLTPSFIIAFAATVLEALPSKDYDNIIIPVGTGLLAEILLF